MEREEDKATKSLTHFSPIFYFCNLFENIFGFLKFPEVIDVKHWVKMDKPRGFFCVCSEKTSSKLLFLRTLSIHLLTLFAKKNTNCNVISIDSTASTT